MGVDVETLKEAVPIEEILIHYGADVPPARAGWISIECPFHGDRTPSAGYSADRNAFNCFVCEVRGDIFDIVMELEELDFAEAKEWIIDQFAPEFRAIQDGVQ